MESGRIDLFYEARRARLRPRSTCDGGALQADVAVPFWRQLFSNPADTDITTLPPITTDLSEITISEALTREALTSTQPRTPGPDGLEATALKTTVDTMVPRLASYFTHALRHGLPPALRRGRTVLIPKSPTASADPPKYRPITVLPMLTRILHKAVELYLRKWIAEHNPFSKTQAGFQKGRSTLEHAATLRVLRDIQRRFRREFYGLFLDIEKAFDSIPHAGLLDVLQHVIRLPPAWVEAIRQLLSGNTTTIFGHEIKITRGCPQGSPLSPLLCLCYLEDLVRFLLARGPPGNVMRPFNTPEGSLWILVTLLLYCDDIALLAVSASTLQWLLDGVREWATSRGLRLSPKSTALVLARRHHQDGNPQPLNAGLAQPLTWDNDFRYLGATFYMDHQGRLRRRGPEPLALNTKGVCFQLILLADLLKGPRGARYASPRLYHQAIHQIVLAQALYSAAVIDVDARTLDTKINIFARRQFGLPCDTNSVFLRTELDIMPTRYLVWRQRLRFALTFFRSHFFRTCLQPFLGPPASLAHQSDVRSGILWMETALTDAGYTLDGFLHRVADDTFTPDMWAKETMDIVRRHYYHAWPHTSTTGQPVSDALARHFDLVCRRLHLPSEVASPHPVTGLLPCGLPLYIQLGGLYAFIGLIFKAFSLRPAFASGVAHHDRARCWWCGTPGIECGTHLLTCSAAPTYVQDRVECLLQQILTETQPPADPTTPPPLTRERQQTALTYIYRLEWPKMTQTTLISTLKGLGRIINTYVNDWAGPLPASCPIRHIPVPP